jgi:NhaP-type Na+/H+ and K+/H+ antiporter
VISSAVAIPSAAGLDPASREFVVYESAVSDIVGVLVFYAWLEAHGDVAGFAGSLFGGGAISLLAAAAAAIGLLYLINRVDGHVRFLPLLAGLILLYALGKAAHLSPLILVLVCGLLLNNHRLLDRVPPLRKLVRDGYEETLDEFKGLVAELTFAVKSFFFLMLGYWTDVQHMTEWQAWAVAGAVLVTIYPVRHAVLRLLGQGDTARLTWLAPRGLITVLLFLAAAESGTLGSFPFGAVMLVVLLTAAATGLAHRDRGTAPVAGLERVAE